MSWIARNGPLNQSEMENNADIIIAYYRGLGIDDSTISAILGNMENESTINPLREEQGQPISQRGFGLVQWTPVTSLQNHCSTLGLSPYTDGDVQLQVIPHEVRNNPSGVAEWYTTTANIRPYYNSGATSDMIGITGSQFLSNSMGWTPEKLAVMFMVGYERPSYDPGVNHYQRRMTSARKWWNYMQGQPPTPTPTPLPKRPKGKFNFLLYNRKKRMEN